MTEYISGVEMLNRQQAEPQLSTESPNPYLRVMPASKLNTGHRGYDKKKYTAMMRRAAWNLPRPFIPSEQCIGTQIYEKTSTPMLNILYGGGLLLRYAR
ncbi:MAG: hypothetical protein V1710_01475 [Candidatus Bathyarchaeota archaeon]